ncbi:MAG: PAS domain-containing protein, partial [Armatimonadota bacterium]
MSDTATTETIEEDVRSRMAETLGRRKEEVFEGWRSRLQDLANLQPRTALFLSPEMLRRARDILPLVIALLRGDEREPCLEAINSFVEVCHRAGLGSADCGRLLIALGDAINAVLDSDPAARYEGCDFCQRRRVQADLDQLRLCASETWHHIAQRELQRRDERHRALLQHASDAILTIDCATGRIQEANLRTLELTGYMAEELSGMEFAGLCPAARDHPLPTPTQAASEPGLLALEDVVLLRKDGAEVPVDLRISCIRVEDDVVALVIIRDITERKELQRHQARYREELERRVEERTEQLRWLTQFNESIIQAMPTPMLVLDDDLYVLRADQAYLDIRGVPAEEVEGKKLTEVFPPSLLNDAGLLDALQRVIATGETVVMEGVRHESPDHAEKILNFRIRHVDNDGSGQVILLWDDVTAAARRTYGLSLLYQIGKAMQGVLDLPRLLFSILTCVTAGPAVGLGLNRAFLLLVDERTGTLKGEMAVGPKSHEHAHDIWSKMAASDHTLEDFLARYDEMDAD